MFSAIGEKAGLYLKGPPTPEECLDRQRRPWAELCRDLLNGIGVPCGEMNGVLHSDAEPKVAALEMSELDELNKIPPMPMPPGPLLGPPPGRR